MLERLENMLIVMVSLVGSISGLLGTIDHLTQWLTSPADDAVTELEKDVVRLETMLQEQQVEINRLREMQS